MKGIGADSEPRLEAERTRGRSHLYGIQPQKAIVERKVDTKGESRKVPKEVNSGDVKRQ